MIYLDSSVLLEIYLGQPGAEFAQSVLAREGAKLSSWLLGIEVPIVLRRVLAGKKRARMLNAAMRRFDADLSALSLASDVQGLAHRIHRDARFASCRALDAVHAGTALQIHEMSGQHVELATFDARLAELAGVLGLPVIAP